MIWVVNIFLRLNTRKKIEAPIEKNAERNQGMMPHC